MIALRYQKWRTKRLNFRILVQLPHIGCAHCDADWMERQTVLLRFCRHEHICLISAQAHITQLWKLEFPIRFQILFGNCKAIKCSIREGRRAILHISISVMQSHVVTHRGEKKRDQNVSLCLSDEPIQVHCGMSGWKHSPCLNTSYFLCLLQPSSSSPSSCQINKAFRISRDVAPRWFTDCHPTTNHSIPVRTYNSSVFRLPHLFFHHSVFSTRLTLRSPSFPDFSSLATFPFAILRFLTCYMLFFCFCFFSILHLLVPHLVVVISLHILTASAISLMNSVFFPTSAPTNALWASLSLSL